MLYDDLPKAIGAVIRSARQQKGLSMEELGKLVGVRKGTIGKWESGTTAKIAPDKLEKVSQVLGVPIAQTAVTVYKTDQVCKNRKEKRETAKGVVFQEWGQDTLALIETFSRLTLEGQKKVLEYSQDLVDNAKYNQQAQEYKADKEQDI